MHIWEISYNFFHIASICRNTFANAEQIHEAPFRIYVYPYTWGKYLVSVPLIANCVLTLVGDEAIGENQVLMIRMYCISGYKFPAGRNFGRIREKKIPIDLLFITLCIYTAGKRIRELNTEIHKYTHFLGSCHSQHQ